MKARASDNSNNIRSVKDYLELFRYKPSSCQEKNAKTGGGQPDQFCQSDQKDRFEKALNEAQTNRRFEIENYWKRAGYFWAFITAIYAAYYNVYKNIYGCQSGHLLLVVLAVLGFFFCLAFCLANLASKHWQKNWEHHQNLLEPQVYGKLYSVFLEGNSYSVSKINLCLSVLCVICSAGLVVYDIVKFSLSAFEGNPQLQWLFFVLLFSILLLAAALFIIKSRSNGEDGEEVSFGSLEYED